MTNNPYQPLKSESSAAINNETSDGVKSVEAAALEQRGISGANWFFWIAGLSLVNSVIAHTGGEVFFVVGLGVTAIADQFSSVIIDENPEIESTVHVVAIGFSVLIAGVVAAFGWLSRKPILPIYAIGMLLYLLDGLLFVLFEDWMSVGFHAFALFWMWNGFQAYRKLREFEPVE